MKRLKEIVSVILVSLTKAFGVPPNGEAQTPPHVPPSFPDTKTNWSIAHCGVYHFHRHLYMEDGRRQNEKPDGTGFRSELFASKKWKAGLLALDFTNSHYKPTTIAGGFVERTLWGSRSKGVSAGIGLSGAGQIRKGYQLPVLGDAYVFCEIGPIHAKAMLFPPIEDSIKPVLVWSVDVRMPKSDKPPKPQ